MTATDTRGEDAERIGQLLAEAEAARRRGDWRDAVGWYLDAAKIPDSALSPSARIRHRYQLTARAADCHIRSGALGQGWSLLRGLFEQIGVDVPSSATGAMIGANFRRGRFMLRERASELGERSLLRELFTRSRGTNETRPRGRAPGSGRSADTKTRTPTPTDALRMLVLDEAARSLTLIHTGLADALRTHHLADVERFGAASDRCRALANEIAMQTRIGGPFDGSVKRLLDRCTQLAEQTGAPLDAAWRQLALATYAFSHGRWRACADACTEANEIFATLADEGLDISHERARVAALHWFALAWLGELVELRKLLDAAILEAESHKDSLMLLEALTGQAMLVWLAADEVEAVRERATELLDHHRGLPGAAWPENAYRRQQYRDLIAQVHADLSKDDASDTWAAIIAAWPELESGFYLPMRTIGLELRTARARTALALAEQFDRDPELTAARVQAHAVLTAAGWDRARLIADVETSLELIQHEGNCCAPALAHAIQAGLLALEGRGDEALLELGAAVREFDAVDMALHRECARLALGVRTPGELGAQLQAQALAWLHGQQVTAPMRMAAALLPGLGL